MKPERRIAITWRRLRASRTITLKGCWEWTKTVNQKGYALTSFNSKQVRVHRLMAALYYGWWDVLHRPRLVIRHKCDNPRCFNPGHLERGGWYENAADALERERYPPNQREGMRRRIAAGR